MIYLIMKIITDHKNPRSITQPNAGAVKFHVISVCLFFKFQLVFMKSKYHQRRFGHIFCVCVAFLSIQSILPAQTNLPAGQTPAGELSAELMTCFDFHLSRMDGTTRVFTKTCDFSTTSLSLLPDHTFQCVIQTGKSANWVQAGNWRMTADSIVSFETDKTLSENLIKSLKKNESNTYKLSKIVYSNYKFNDRHLLPVSSAKENTIDPAKENNLYGPGYADVSASLSGRICKSKKGKKPAANLQIMLFSVRGQLLQQSITDADGKFNFELLSPDQRYEVDIALGQKGIKKRKKLYFFDSKNKVHVSHREPLGKTEFADLLPDN
jgi:hypothetical protein